MLTLSLVKMASHPASHSCAMEMREADFKFGNILANLADSGKFGIGSNASCVLWMMWLLGRRTDMGVLAILLFFILQLKAK